MSEPALDETEPDRISTGSKGLDDVLGGGFDPERMYLYEGRPGSGKTTLALQFLLEGVRLGEAALYITLSETERELRLVARNVMDGPLMALPYSNSCRRRSASTPAKS